MYRTLGTGVICDETHVVPGSTGVTASLETWGLVWAFSTSLVALPALPALDLACLLAFLVIFFRDYF